MVTKEEIKQKYVDLLLSTKLEGLDKLLTTLDKMNFFVSPATDKGNLSFPAGLPLLGLRVHEIYSDKIAQYGLKVKPEEAILSALLQCLGKFDTFVLKNIPASDKQKKYLMDLFIEKKIPMNPQEASTLNSATCSALIDWVINGGDGEQPKDLFDWEITPLLPLPPEFKSIFVARKIIPNSPAVTLALAYANGCSSDNYMYRQMYAKAKEKHPCIVHFANSIHESLIAKSYKRLDGVQSILY